jgi:hypothetical protein
MRGIQSEHQSTKKASRSAKTEFRVFSSLSPLSAPLLCSLSQILIKKQRVSQISAEYVSQISVYIYIDDPH